MVDEDARQLVADRLVDEQRGDRRVDAARECAEHALRADGCPDALDLLLDDGGGRPRRRGAGDLVEEVLEDVLPVRRVHDLGMELDAVQRALPVLEGGDRRRGRGGRDARTRRRGGHRVAVAHPHDLLGRQVVEELRVLGCELRLAELGRVRPLDGASEVARHELHPVADAERRDPELEDARVDVRGALRIHGCGSAREHDRRGVAAPDLLGGEPVADELGVDARLPHPARDQLAVLPAEVDDEDRPLLRSDLGGGQRYDLRHQPRR